MSTPVATAGKNAKRANCADNSNIPIALSFNLGLNLYIARHDQIVDITANEQRKVYGLSQARGAIGTIGRGRSTFKCILGRLGEKK